MKSLTFTKEAIEGIKDLKRLENNTFMEDFEFQLDRIKIYGEKAGIALENKHGRDLRGYYKIYFAEQSWRIVFQEVDKKFELVEITLVAPRDIVYELADIIINN